MTTETSEKKELSSAFVKAVNELQALVTPLSEVEINTVPYEGSWTPGQLFRHVTKSIDGLGEAMAAPGSPADRDPGERVAELKNMFLDFSRKMKSPEFIVPEPGPYGKQNITKELASVEKKLVQNAAEADMTELITGLPLGPITKWEMYNFILFHTQRHIHQMKKMVDAL